MRERSKRTLRTGPGMGRLRPTIPAILLAALAMLSTGRAAQAQAFVAGNETSGDETPENSGQHPFLLPAQPTEIGEAMEDFRRFAGRKQWEKAFRQLEKVFSATSNG